MIYPPLVDEEVIGHNLQSFHKILRIFDVLPNFPLTTSETKRDY